MVQHQLVSTRRSGSLSDQIISAMDRNAFLHDISDDASVVVYSDAEGLRLKRNDDRAPVTPSRRTNRCPRESTRRLLRIPSGCPPTDGGSPLRARVDSGFIRSTTEPPGWCPGTSCRSLPHRRNSVALVVNGASPAPGRFLRARARRSRSFRRPRHLLRPLDVFRLVELNPHAARHSQVRYEAVAMIGNGLVKPDTAALSSATVPRISSVKKEMSC